MCNRGEKRSPSSHHDDEVELVYDSSDDFGSGSYFPTPSVAEAQDNRQFRITIRREARASAEIARQVSLMIAADKNANANVGAGPLSDVQPEQSSSPEEDVNFQSHPALASSSVGEQQQGPAPVANGSATSAAGRNNAGNIEPAGNAISTPYDLPVKKTIGKKQKLVLKVGMGKDKVGYKYSVAKTHEEGKKDTMAGHVLPFKKGNMADEGHVTNGNVVHEMENIVNDKVTNLEEGVREGSNHGNACVFNNSEEFDIEDWLGSDLSIPKNILKGKKANTLNAIRAIGMILLGESYEENEKKDKACLGSSSKTLTGREIAPVDAQAVVSTSPAPVGIIDTNSDADALSYVGAARDDAKLQQNSAPNNANHIETGGDLDDPDGKDIRAVGTPCEEEFPDENSRDLVSLSRLPFGDLE